MCKQADQSIYIFVKPDEKKLMLPQNDNGDDADDDELFLRNGSP